MGKFPVQPVTKAALLKDDPRQYVVNETDKRQDISQVERDFDSLEVYKFASMITVRSLHLGVKLHITAFSYSPLTI